MAKHRDPHVPDPDDQSGSTGRNTGPARDDPGQDGKPGSGDNTGQGQYGQSGFGKGRFDKGTGPRSNYDEDESGREEPRSRDSNHGSGAVENVEKLREERGKR